MKQTSVEDATEHRGTPEASPSVYCEHPSARRIRVYVPYAEANTIRLRAAHRAVAREAHVSWLYAIPGGWGWTICAECRALEQKQA